MHYQLKINFGNLYLPANNKTNAKWINLGTGIADVVKKAKDLNIGINQLQT